MAEFRASAELITSIVNEFIEDGLVPAANRDDFLSFMNSILRQDKTGQWTRELQTNSAVRKQIVDAANNPESKAALFDVLRKQESAALTGDLLSELESEGIDTGTKPKKRPSFESKFGATSRADVEGRRKAVQARKTRPFAARPFGGPASGFDPLDLMDFPQIEGPKFSDDVLEMMGDMRTGYTAPIGPQPAGGGFLRRTPAGTLPESDVIRRVSEMTADELTPPTSKGSRFRLPFTGGGGGGKAAAKAGKAAAAATVPAKLSGLGKVLGPIGLALMAYDLFSNVGEARRKPIEYRLGEIRKSGDELLSLLQPSSRTSVSESRALRDIAEAGGRSGPIMPSQELMTLVEGQQETLARLKQRVKPTMSEAYARAGLL